MSGEVPKIGQRIMVHHSKFYEEADGPGKKVVVWQGYVDRKVHVFASSGYAFGIQDDYKEVEGTIVSDPDVGAAFVRIKTE